MMEQKVKTDKIPAHAHLLYLKLYCEKKGGKNKKTIQQAKKSWISLNFAKKKHFYETTMNRNFLTHAHTLSKTEVYLKKQCSGKHDTGLDKAQSLDDQGFRDESNILENEISLVNNTNNDLVQDEVMNDNNETSVRDNQETHTIQNNQEAAERIPINELREPIPTEELSLHEPTRPCDIKETVIEEIEGRESNYCDSDQGGPMNSMNEPAPPTVKSGKDLYDMIKAPNEEDWNEISIRQKRRYHAAVRALKREYIKKYAKYLESLSKKELFDHYMKTLY